VTGRLLAVCRVHRLHLDPGVVGVTAIDKRPLDEPVAVRRLGLYGDVIADREHHGGPDKAVYAYAQESADRWADELGGPVAPGQFGENLRTAGLDVDGAEVGERWQVGDDGVGPLLEVTMPRIPCQTFGRYLGQERWVRRFTAAGLPGAYLRVLRTGRMAADDAVAVVHRPGHGVSVARWFSDGSPADARLLVEADEAGAVELAPALRAYVDRALTRA
jgi:MOSC domain-containing protein YiiM